MAVAKCHSKQNARIEIWNAANNNESCDQLGNLSLLMGSYNEQKNFYSECGSCISFTV